MRISAFSALALGLGICVVQLSACSNSAEDCHALATCGAAAGTPSAGSAGKSGGGGGGAAGGDASGGSNGAGMSSMSGSGGAMGGGGEGGGGPAACTGDVSSESACWTNELGVFVSSDAGDDSAAGTKEAPFKTIKRGIESAAGKNVYVCVGTKDYKEETIKLNTGTDGIHIYGGFECSTWTYATTRSAQVLSDSNIALRIDGLKKGAHIENVSFQAADATGTGVDASSYGAFVTGSKGVVLTRVKLTAGAGAKGADGAVGTKGADGMVPGTDQIGAAALCGSPADGTPGKWLGASVCGSRGGSGGGGVVDSSGPSGTSGTPSANVDPPNNENRGLGATTGADGGAGSKGSNGNSGNAGLAASESGTFTAVGFTVANGQNGNPGFPGQGGGGGGASKGSATCRGASGGAGGMGGCGGEAGKAGGGGGASVGIFSWASEVSLVASTVQGRAGGAGGAGGNGGLPGAGAAGGAGGEKDQALTIALGGNGGRGGDGGRGGNGSGGTGGPSFAVVYGETKPTYDADTVLAAGTPGAAGVGGQQVSTTKAPDGSVGKAGAEFQVQ
jgi:hypothetical protein